MRRFHFLIGFLCFVFQGVSQEKQEVIPPSFIKSIIFKGPTDDQFPVVTLAETLTLQFDDLNANEADYYYKIIHCNYDWTPSNLNKNQYLNGQDDIRIVTYENSFTTLQSYSHYTLQIPNQQTRLSITGNYMLEVYNDYDELMFSRRFVVYKSRLTVGVNLKRSRNMEFANTKQVVQFEIDGTSNIINPQEQIKVAILQNYHWPTALFNIKPQYTLGDKLMYKYDQETAFWAGNEYLYFDSKSVRVAGNGIRRIELKDIYQTYLYPAQRRDNKVYTYFPDINGDFQINTQNGRNNETEAEYTAVHFSLEYDPEIGMNDVFVYGKFNNYELTDENLMTRNEQTGLLEATMILKQGFYNYKFVMTNNKGDVLYNVIDGNFHVTENNYMVLVYYRGYGDLYDSLIGIGYGSSSNLTN